MKLKWHPVYANKKNKQTKRKFLKLVCHKPQKAMDGKDGMSDWWENVFKQDKVVAHQKRAFGTVVEKEAKYHTLIVKDEQIVMK